MQRGHLNVMTALLETRRVSSTKRKQVNVDNNMFKVVMGEGRDCNTQVMIHPHCTARTLKFSKHTCDIIPSNHQQFNASQPTARCLLLLRPSPQTSRSLPAIAIALSRTCLENDHSIGQVLCGCGRVAMGTEGLPEGGLVHASQQLADCFVTTLLGVLQRFTYVCGYWCICYNT